MKFNSKLAQRLFLCVTPLVTGSVFVSLPSLAATLSTSEATVILNNFSHNPESVAAVADTYAYTQITNSGEVATNAYGEAAFIPDTSASQTFAYNLSSSSVKGEGNSYLGQAQSTAGVLGYNFIIGAGETFSFNFNAALALDTSIDDPSRESADAVGNIAFMLYNSTDLNNPLDFFTLSGKLTSQGNDDFLSADHSTSVSFEENNAISSQGTEESAFASIQGWFSRTFSTLTHLTLVEFKTNEANACAWK